MVLQGVIKYSEFNINSFFFYLNFILRLILLCLVRWFDDD